MEHQKFNRNLGNNIRVFQNHNNYKLVKNCGKKEYLFFPPECNNIKNLLL